MFNKGFKLNYIGARFGILSLNRLTANENKSKLEEKINKEDNAGRVMGPFSNSLIPNMHDCWFGIAAE